MRQAGACALAWCIMFHAMQYDIKWNCGMSDTEIIKAGMRYATTTFKSKTIVCSKYCALNGLLVTRQAPLACDIRPVS